MNSEEYHLLKSEVFTQGVYYFESDNPRPRIIDAGAHIGLSTLYFKKIFPFSHIISLEPNPLTFSLLEKNIFENQVQDVELHQAALAAGAEKSTFFMDDTENEWFSTAGFSPGAWNGMQNSKQISVETLQLASFLDKTVDFLKMDIEGAEQEVLLASGDQIKQVKKIIIEFHTVPHQSLSKILEFLQEKGFFIQLWKDGKSLDKRFARGLFYIEATSKDA